MKGLLLFFVPAMEGQVRGRTDRVSCAVSGMISMLACPVC